MKEPLSNPSRYPIARPCENNPPSRDPVRRAANRHARGEVTGSARASSANGGGAGSVMVEQVARRLREFANAVQLVRLLGEAYAGDPRQLTQHHPGPVDVRADRLDRDEVLWAGRVGINLEQLDEVIERAQGIPDQFVDAREFLKAS